MKLCRYSIVAASLALLLLTPTHAFANVEPGDQTDLSDAEIAAAIQDGQVPIDDVLAAGAEDAAPLRVAGNHVFTTIGGANRYETSAAQAIAALPQAPVVIIAGGETYADSIAGSGLAGALGAPILLTPPSSLDASTKDALERLSPREVIILGGADVVSPAVEQQIKGLVERVTRLSGQTRFETQQAIYAYGVQNNLWVGDTAIVATGMNFADALSVSPVAYDLMAPIFFTDASYGLPAEQLASIRQFYIGKQPDQAKSLVIGGPQAVSSGTESTLAALGPTKRLGGADRYATSRLINDYAIANYGFAWEGVAFSSGWSPWDSLGGGTMQGQHKRLLALMDDNGPTTAPSIPVPGKPGHMVYLGGPNVYSNAFKAQVALHMGYSITDIQGFKVYLDAGHGFESSGAGTGFDPGAISGSYREVDLTRELADKVADQLRSQYGLDVIVNKNGWYKLRQTQASMLDCGVLVSIHFNAGGGTGTESYIHSQNSPYGSAKLQRSVHTSLVAALGLTDRGMKKEQLAVLSGKLPSTLLEVSFVDRPSDMTVYRSKIDAVARGIADGIAHS